MSLRLQRPKSRRWMAIIALLAGCFTASCRREGKLLRAGTLGVTVEGGAALRIELPIGNGGVTDAHGVKVSEIELHGGHLDVPAPLPVDLGTILADGRKVLQIRFNVPGLDPTKTYEIEVKGRYRGRRDRDKDGDDRERKFH